MFNSKISLGSTGFHRHTKMSAPKNFNAELILSFVVVCIIIGHTTLFYQRTVNIWKGTQMRPSLLCACDG